MATTTTPTTTTPTPRRAIALKRARGGTPTGRPTTGRRTTRVQAGDDDARGTIERGTTVGKDLSTFAKKTATTFAPRQSGAVKKNPAYKGSALYAIFEAQAYAAVAVGGLLAFNVIYPSDEPSIARLMGMWSVWMFTVPSLRARDCSAREKDALNLLFVAIPLVNVIIPFFWKSFAGVFTADVALMVAVYAQKGMFSDEAKAEDAALSAAAAAPAVDETAE